MQQSRPINPLGRSYNPIVPSYNLVVPRQWTFDLPIDSQCNNPFAASMAFQCGPPQYTTTASTNLKYGRLPPPRYDNVNEDSAVAEQVSGKRRRLGNGGQNAFQRQEGRLRYEFRVSSFLSMVMVARAHSEGQQRYFTQEGIQLAVTMCRSQRCCKHVAIL
jgi:hypothetical protein